MNPRYRTTMATSMGCTGVPQEAEGRGQKTDLSFVDQDCPRGDFCVGLSADGKGNDVASEG